MGGGGYVAGPAGLAATLTRTPLVLTEADSHLGPRQPPAGRPRAARLPRVPDRGPRRERYLVTGRPVPRAVLGGRPRRPPGAASGCPERPLPVRRRRQPGRPLDQLRRASKRSPSATGATSTCSTWAAAATTRSCERRLAAAPRPRRATRWSTTSPDLGDVLAAGDLVLARSGGSVFEVAAAGRPAILVPYPHATADHQSANAAWMARGGRGDVRDPSDGELGRRAAARPRSRRAARRRRRGCGDGGGLALRWPSPTRRAGSPPRFWRRRDDADERDWTARRLHFIGIGGAGMSGLALVCARLGADGDRQRPQRSSYMERLRAAGLEPASATTPRTCPEGAEVVVSTAIGDDNPELALARERGVEPIHRGELLAELCAEKRLIAVAGTHGKTTTTAMAVWALRAIGADPAFFVGGEVPGVGEDGERGQRRLGRGRVGRRRGRRERRQLPRAEPEIAVVTNVEMDHHTRWGSLAELHRAFERFAAPAAGAVLPAPAVGTACAAADRRAEPLYERIAAGRSVRRFSDACPGRTTLSLAVPGRHNRANARAALAAIELAGLDVAAAATALADFPGVRRRLELKGGARRHPHLRRLRPPPDRGPRRALGPARTRARRLIAVFQPHLYSRTKALASEFGAALALADEVVVLDVYPAREEPVGELAGVSGLRVAQAAAERMGGRPVWWLPDADTAGRALSTRSTALDRGRCWSRSAPATSSSSASRCWSEEMSAPPRASSATSRWPG